MSGSVGSESPSPPGKSSNATDIGVKMVISMNSQSNRNRARATIAKTMGKTTIQNCSKNRKSPKLKMNEPPIKYNQRVISACVNICDYRLLDFSKILKGNNAKNCE